MGESDTYATAPIVLERLMLKGKGLLDLCLELNKNLCVKGFIDAQIARGDEYLPVVEAMRDHIDAELEQSPRGKRRELLLDLREYIAAELATMQSTFDEPVLP